jgi:3-oxoacyl-[acyl-carrier protein] reductase
MHITNSRWTRNTSGLSTVVCGRRRTLRKVRTRRVALVTGATRGLGRATALQLARDGADVALFGCDAAALAETAAAVRATRPGAVATVHAFDATSEAATNVAVAEAMAAHGRIDVAVANACQSVDGLLLRLQPADLERLLASNLRSAFYLCAAVAKPMLAQRGGTIVIVSSAAGAVCESGRSAHAASKAALLDLATSLAEELGPRAIRVDVVAPGRTGSCAQTAATVALLVGGSSRGASRQTLLVGGSAMS